MSTIGRPYYVDPEQTFADHAKIEPEPLAFYPVNRLMPARSSNLVELSPLVLLNKLHLILK